MLTNKEKRKYERHLFLPEIGEAGQLKLKNAKVLVVGAGALGTPVLKYLTGAGVGTIGLADNDLVADSNLPRQVLYGDPDVGKHKAIVAGQKLSAQNTDVNLVVHNTFLVDSRAIDIVEKYDIVVDCTDNFPTRYLLNDICILQDKPLVYGSIYKFEGQVAVFNFQNGPSYRCMFPNAPQYDKMLDASQIGLVGTVPSIIGSIQATEVLKMIVGFGEVLSGSVLIVNTFNMDFYKVNFKRNDNNFLIENLSYYDEFYGTSSNKHQQDVHKRSWIKKK